MSCASSVLADGTAILAVSGDLDVGSSAVVRKSGLEMLAAPACQILVVDLYDVPFIDSTGIAALLVIRAQTLRARQKLLVRRPSERVARVLDLTGLRSVFTIES